MSRKPEHTTDASGPHVFGTREGCCTPWRPACNHYARKPGCPWCATFDEDNADA